MSNMTRFISMVALAAMLVFGAPTLHVVAKTLTSAEAASLISTLRSLNIDPAVVTNIENTLNSGSSAQAPAMQSCYSFNANLKKGQSGVAVTALQNALKNDGIMVTVTNIFDQQTFTAVIAFQQKYASTILTPNGLRLGTGFVGVSTRAKLNQVRSCAAPSIATACKAGDAFNIFTGARCGVSGVCQAGDLYNTQTGARCSSGGGSRSSGGGSSRSPSIPVPVITITDKPFDYNNDNKVDSDDLAILIQVAQDNIVCPASKNCDVNNDGTIADVADLASLGRIISGQTTVIPPPPPPPASTVPTITALSPNQGLVSSTITINGTNLSSATAVLFYNADNQLVGSVNGSSITVLSGTSLRVSLQWALSGNVTSPLTVQVETPSGRSNGLSYTITVPIATNTGSGSPYDYNDDGAVNSTDVTYLSDVVIGDRVCPTNKWCDVDGDGTEGVNDVILLNNMVKGIASSAAWSKYDYTKDGTVDVWDVALLTRVANGYQVCPTSMNCDVNSDTQINLLDVTALVAAIDKYLK